jgi:hypothetical protein
MKGSKVLPQTMSTLGVKHTLPPITTLEPRNRQDRHVGGRDTTYGVVNVPSTQQRNSEACGGHRSHY